MRRAAFLLLSSVLILLALGVAVVTSASSGREVLRSDAGLWGSFHSHGFKVLLGVLLILLGASVDYRSWARHSRLLYIVALVLLILVLVPGIGAKVNGSRRWFRSDWLPFAFQPAEYAKLAMILFLGQWIARTPDLSRSFTKTFLPGAAAVLLPAGLILMQTDFGTFLLLTMLGFSLLLLAGARVQHLLLLASTTLPLVIYLVVDRLSYVKQRFTGFAGSEPPLQVKFSLSALQVGGLGGVGLGGSHHKLHFLPHCDNDFILSIIGEELGFLGTTAILFLYTLLIWSGVKVLLGVRSRFGFVVVSGVLLVIVTQALINIAVATGAAPVKGMPLPFVSAGGSSLVVLCLGVGLVLSVARHSALPSVSLASGEGGDESRQL
jgi:cell division protein FtsW